MNPHTAAMLFLGGLMAWTLVGCLALWALDQTARFNGSLLQWARECQFGGAVTVIVLWPSVFVLAALPPSEG